MKAFNRDDFDVVLKHCELELLRRKPTHATINASGPVAAPIYALFHRGQVVSHLYDNDLIPTNSLTRALMTAYKEMFYAMLAQGNMWHGRTLERAISMMYNNLTGDNLYEKCRASYWGIRDRNVMNAIPTSALQRWRGKYMATFHGNIKFDVKHSITTIELVITLHPGNYNDVRKTTPTLSIPMQVASGNYIPSYKELFANYMPVIDAFIEQAQFTTTL